MVWLSDIGLFLLGSVAAVLLVCLPPFRLLDEEHREKSRIATLDGLRGFLALAVVCHHGEMYRVYLVEKSWQWTSNANAMLGLGGVAMFFMLTAYLFWGRLVARDGRVGWSSLFINRVFRIGPLYLLATSSAILLSLLAMPRLTSLPELAVQIATWLPLGLISGRSVNGFPTGFALFEVTWSLRYEWLFYLSLPALVLFTRSGRLHLYAALLSAACSLALLAYEPNLDVACLALFSMGMLCASLIHEGYAVAAPRLLHHCALGGLLTYAVAGPNDLYNPVTITVLAAAFYLVACDVSLFGLFHSGPARRLGTASYGLYLLQGLVFTGLRFFPGARAFVVSSSALYAGYTLLSILLLVMVAAAANVFIEAPGIRLGKSIGRWAAARRARQPAA